MLEALNINKSYFRSNNALHVLKGIDLRIEEGAIVSVVGPSGAGKSTLLHVLGGLDKPDQGEVHLDGENIYGLKDAARARIRNTKVGFVFQFYHLLPEFTALENVLLPAMIQMRQGAKKQFEGQGLDLLDKVGLKQRADHKPYQLSGGEQQRVAIARALINNPRIVFCDEPTGNLDSESGDGIIRLLMDLNKKNHQTLVIVTHDEQIAMRSHRRIHIRDGILVPEKERVGR
ncbi:MAG: ABC transporter ATP-binding protein [Candidatus Omnitrophica bacterium]|nr:ABC transporter ATP-binding protein [Candidatus Omnitrophota bacterium]